MDDNTGLLRSLRSLSEYDMSIKVAGTVNDSIVDGPGLRFTIFTQGCAHSCPNCHNTHTHALDGGKNVKTSILLEEIDRNPLLDGVTLSGGEPFLQAEQLVPLARAIKQRGLSLVIYTGFLFEQIIANDHFKALALYADIIIDGKFIEAEKSLDKAFTGSKNQRIIDVSESLRCDTVVELSF